MKLKRRMEYLKILTEVKDSPVLTMRYQGNNYHFKLDYMLPYGACHYARIFAQLIFIKECLGIIRPGDVLLETTSGSGGRAAAAIAAALGYQIIIGIPAGGEKAREDAIRAEGAQVIVTPKEAYVNGFPEFIKSFLQDHPETKYLNHVMGNIKGKGPIVNMVATKAFEGFTYEVLEAGILPDVVILPLGNGTTTLPTARVLKSINRDTLVVGFEAVTAAMSFRKKHEGKYEEIYGINPELCRIHNLPGTSPAKAIFPAPALENSLPYLDEVKLVTNEYIDEVFEEIAGCRPSKKSKEVVVLKNWKQKELRDFGRTGLAGFDVALAVAREKKLNNKNFLIPVFDAA